MPSEPKPEKQYNPDAEFGRAFLIGCGVLILVFLLGTAVITFFWMR